MARATLRHSMQAPPWLPPFAPAQRTPSMPSTAVSAVGPALLRAPLWAPQEHETAQEHSAFLAWLMGGYELARPPGQPPKGTPPPEARLVVRGDWAAAVGALGGTSAQVHALAVRWSWEVRGREYWTTTRAIGEREAQGQAESVLEYAALARELDRKWLELSILEVDKALVQARRIMPEPGQENEARFLPRLFENRELIALRRADGALEIQRFRAGVLARAADEAPEGTNWAALPPADLEAYRRLREKAKGAG